MKNMELFSAYVARVMGKPLEETAPVFLSGDEVAEALWPLNERFRLNFEQIRSISYNASFEAEADSAIEAEALHSKDWSDVSAEAWRVLLERHTQAVMMAVVNQLHGNPLMPVPEGLPRSARTISAMLFLMYEMKLPYPVADRSDFELPEGAAPISLTRH